MGVYECNRRNNACRCQRAKEEEGEAVVSNDSLSIQSLVAGHRLLIERWRRVRNKLKNAVTCVRIYHPPGEVLTQDEWKI